MNKLKLSATVLLVSLSLVGCLPLSQIERELTREVNENIVENNYGYEVDSQFEAEKRAWFSQESNNQEVLLKPFHYEDETCRLEYIPETSQLNEYSKSILVNVKYTNLTKESHNYYSHLRVNGVYVQDLDYYIMAEPLETQEIRLYVDVDTFYHLGAKQIKDVTFVLLDNGLDVKKEINLYHQSDEILDKEMIQGSILVNEPDLKIIAKGIDIEDIEKEARVPLFIFNHTGQPIILDDLELKINGEEIGDGYVDTFSQGNTFTFPWFWEDEEDDSFLDIESDKNVIKTISLDGELKVGNRGRIIRFQKDLKGNF